MFIEADDVIRTSIEDKPRWEAILAAPLVVFDDLGTERRDDKAVFLSAFSRLLNTAYSQRRRLLITCNITPQVFKQVYGERELDRLREAGKWSTIGGESVRRYEREPGCDDD
jgi:DNA replication protein DnaC